MCIPDKLYIYYLKGKLKQDIISEDYIGCWHEAGDSFLFFQKKSDHIVDELVASDNRLELKDIFEVDYFDWIGGKIETFGIGDIRIIPVWDKPKKLRDKDILLDPSVVFGSGTHNTTYNCLVALDYIYEKEKDLDSVLDLGCGTGILSLFCAKKGANKIFSVDLNPLAVKATKKNAKLNLLEEKILPIWGRAQDFFGIYTDVLVANMVFDVISVIVNIFNLKKYRWLIFSGLFLHQVPEIENILKGRGVSIVEIIGQESGWPTIMASSR